MALLKRIEQVIRDGRLPWPPDDWNFETGEPEPVPPASAETEPEIPFAWLDDVPELR